MRENCLLAEAVGITSVSWYEYEKTIFVLKTCVQKKGGQARYYRVACGKAN